MILFLVDKYCFLQINTIDTVLFRWLIQDPFPLGFSHRFLPHLLLHLFRGLVEEHEPFGQVEGAKEWKCDDMELL